MLVINPHKTSSSNDSRLLFILPSKADFFSVSQFSLFRSPQFLKNTSCPLKSSKCLLYLFIFRIRPQIIKNSQWVKLKASQSFFFRWPFVYCIFSFLLNQKRRTMFYQLFGQIVIKKHEFPRKISSCQIQTHSLFTTLLIIFYSLWKLGCDYCQCSDN